MQQFFDTIHTLFTKMLVKIHVIKIYLKKMLPEDDPVRLKHVVDIF
jgi:hypothetical protein